jgi:hypothetical protein
MSPEPCLLCSQPSRPTYFSISLAAAPPGFLPNNNLKHVKAGFSFAELENFLCSAYTNVISLAGSKNRKYAM